MTWKKANEAYFGDSFNRDGILCSYTVADSGDLTSVSGYADTATICANNIALEKTKAMSGDLNCSGTVKAVDFAIESATDSLRTELKKLQAQIDELKLNMVPKTGTHKLRSALATLKYEREIK
jgi:hypothetical protein